MSQLQFGYDAPSKSLLVQFVDASQTPPKVLESTPVAAADLDGFLTYVTQLVGLVKAEAAKFTVDDKKPASFADADDNLKELHEEHGAKVAESMGFGPFGPGGLIGGVLGPILGGGGGGFGGGGWGNRPVVVEPQQPVVVQQPTPVIVGNGGWNRPVVIGGQQPVWGAGGYQQPVIVQQPSPQMYQVQGIQSGTQVWAGQQYQVAVNGQPAVLVFN